jgi:hypothetical protein
VSKHAGHRSQESGHSLLVSSGLPAHVGNMHTVVHPACPGSSRPHQQAFLNLLPNLLRFDTQVGLESQDSSHGLLVSSELPAHVGNMHTVVHPACPGSSRRTSKHFSFPLLPPSNISRASVFVNESGDNGELQAH